MPKTPHKSVDISPISTRYASLLEKFRVFLSSVPLPSTKSELIGYHQSCNQCESELLNLKSEILLTKSEILRDVKSLSKDYIQNSFCTDQWEMKRKLENHPPIADAQLSIDKLSAMADVLENYIWVFKSNKTLSVENYKYMATV
jgi:hypothetical protein